MIDLSLRLRSWTIDWNGEPMDDREPPRDGVICRDLRNAADEIDRLRSVVRVNALRWGHTDTEIDAILNQQLKP